MPDTVEKATGIADAADAIEGLLSGFADKEQHQDEQHDDSDGEHSHEEGQSSEHERDENVDPNADETQSDEAEASKDDGDGKDDANDDEEQADANAQQPQTVTVKIDGKEVEVPLEEAVKGYQRQADYSRKTAELAEHRRAFEQKVQEFEGERQSVIQERGQYAHLLRALEQRLEELAPQEPDWVALAQQLDPADYQKARATWDAINDQKAAAKAERDRLEGVQKQESVKQLQAKLKAGSAKLLEYNPDWKDGKKWDADRRAIFDYGMNSLGFSPQEIANASDPRAIIAVHKAMLYDQLMANKPKPNIKGKKVSPKPLAAGSANARNTPSSDVTKAKQRLAQTGRIGDAASVFERLL